jgi:glutathione-specific gamma-glutamylcyclotransferase
VLTRESILAGLIDEKVREAERQGLVDFVPVEQRKRSRRAMLDALGGDEVWLFGYGSLIWNPCIHYAQRESALLYGYHRDFCLSMLTGRGTPDRPGLMLALKPGGACRGVAFRIEHAHAEQELEVVWNREMVSGAYVPRVVVINTPVGRRRAVTFVANRRYRHYRPDLGAEESAAVIADAHGWLGRCSDYLRSLVEHLERMGVADRAMRRLWARVRVIESGRAGAGE